MGVPQAQGEVAHKQLVKMAQVGKAGPQRSLSLFSFVKSWRIQ